MLSGWATQAAEVPTWAALDQDGCNKLWSGRQGKEASLRDCQWGFFPQKSHTPRLIVETDFTGEMVNKADS